MEIKTDRVIEITPELNRRVQEERRREPREKIAKLERDNAALREAVQYAVEWFEEEHDTKDIPIAALLREVLKQNV